MPMSCTVTETLNGEWELTLEHEIDERGKWTWLSEGCILRAPVPAAMTPRVGLVTQQYQTKTYTSAALRQHAQEVRGAAPRGRRGSDQCQKDKVILNHPS